MENTDNNGSVCVYWRVKMKCTFSFGGEIRSRCGCQFPDLQ